MALTHPWWGLAVLLALCAVACVAFWWRRRRTMPRGALPFAAAARLRTLPRFTAIARQRLRWAIVELAALAVAASGIALLVARPVDQETLPGERSNRDVVLCLDVSGSMANVVRDVLGSFRQLASDLDGERLALVMFDSSAVTVFPLTDDAAYIREQLDAASREVGGHVVGTNLGDVGSSLIGDGLASCLQRFDVTDDTRSRTVVLATDNQTSGRSLYSLEEATTLAHDSDVLLFGITPNDNTVAAAEALKAQMERTGGDTLLLGPNAALTDIVDAVEATQARELDGPSRISAEDLIAPGVVLASAGIVVACIARRRGTP